MSFVTSYPVEQLLARVRSVTTELYMRQPIQPTDGFPSMRDIGLANDQQRLVVSRDILTIETPLGREITEYVVSFLATESVNENDLLDWALTAPDSLRSFLDAVSDTDGGTLTFLRTVRVLSGVSPVITDVNDHGVLLNAVNRHRFPSHFTREIDHYVDDIVARWSDPERPGEVRPFECPKTILTTNPTRRCRRWRKEKTSFTLLRRTKTSKDRSSKTPAAPLPPTSLVKLIADQVKTPKDPFSKTPKDPFLKTTKDPSSKTPVAQGPPTSITDPHVGGSKMLEAIREDSVFAETPLARQRRRRPKEKKERRPLIAALKLRKRRWTGSASCPLPGRASGEFT